MDTSTLFITFMGSIVEVALVYIFFITLFPSRLKVYERIMLIVETVLLQRIQHQSMFRFLPMPRENFE